jgi:hypothetical protein
MPHKCSLTRDYCPAKAGGFWDGGDSCPIRKYQHSNRYFESGEITGAAVGIFDDTCRYYGIERAAKLKNKKFMEV